MLVSSAPRERGHCALRGCALRSRALPRSTARSKYAAISHVRCFFAWRVEHEHLRKDPALRLPHPKLPRLLPRPISEDNVKVAIDNAPDRLRAYLVLAAYAGLRCTEIAALTRHDVLDRADPPVLVAHGKGNKGSSRCASGSSTSSTPTACRPAARCSPASTASQAGSARTGSAPRWASTWQDSTSVTARTPCATDSPPGPDGSPRTSAWCRSCSAPSPRRPPPATPPTPDREPWRRSGCSTPDDREENGLGGPLGRWHPAARSSCA